MYSTCDRILFYIINDLRDEPSVECFQPAIEIGVLLLVISNKYFNQREFYSFIPYIIEDEKYMETREEQIRDAGESRPAPYELEKAGTGKAIIYFVVFFVLNLGLYIFNLPYVLFITLIIADILFVPVLWGRSAKSIVQKSVFKSLKNKGKGLGSKIFNLLIGLKVTDTRTYFVEGRGKHRSLNNISTIYSQRIFNVIGAAIGFTFILALVLKFVFNPTSVDDINNMFGSAVILIFASPYLFSWLLPTQWVLQDMDLRAKDAEYNVINLGDEMKSGIFGKLLGITGLITGLGFFTDLGDDYWNAIIPVGPYQTIFIYIRSLMFIGIYIACIGGTASIITLIYLGKYHVKIVNACRDNASKFLKTMLTDIRPQVNFEKNLA